MERTNNEDLERNLVEDLLQSHSDETLEGSSDDDDNQEAVCSLSCQDVKKMLQDITLFAVSHHNCYLSLVEGLYEDVSISNQPNLIPVEIHLFFFDVIAL